MELLVPTLIELFELKTRKEFRENKAPFDVFHDAFDDLS